MNSNPSTYLARGLMLLAVGIFIANSAVAAPGTLATEPLQTSASAPPNLMFMIDTSGSMSNVVPDTPYNPATDYTPSGCGSTITQATSTTSTYYLYIIGGEPFIHEGSNDHALGTFCFDRTTNYYGKLNADNGSGNDKTTTGYFKGQYTGNYLNWYFSTADNTMTWTTQSMKPAPGVDSRMNIAKSAATGLIDGLANMRVGLTTFDGNTGGYIQQNVKTLDSTHKTALTTSITNLANGGVTPVAETLLDIGRYFVGHGGTNNPGAITATVDPPETNGQYNGDLTLHPDGTPITDDDGDIFAHNPTYRAGLTNESPIQYWCQQNFAILLTDGRPQSDRGLASTSYTVEAVRDYDGDCPEPPCNHEDNNTQYDQKTPGSAGPNGGIYSYESEGTDYMDDVAAMLYDIDLRPDIDDSSDNEVKNNLITYTIGFADDQVINDALIRDTAVNGGGEFITASNADALAEAFTRATKSIIAQSSTSSAVTFNSSTLSSQSAVYQALFNTVRWSGELRSIPLNGFTGAVLTNCTAGTNNCWSAADQLDDQTPSDRVILTYNDTVKNGVAFTHPDDHQSPDTTEIPQSLIDDLCGFPGGCTTDYKTTTDTAEQTADEAFIEGLIDYLRGDRTHESSGTTYDFRTRTQVLGDLVNASPVYVSRPASKWPNRDPFPVPPTIISDPDYTYSTWANTDTVKNRASIVYAASNDGMLHGFRTTESSAGAGDAGTEVFAYIPSGTFSANDNEGLHYLAEPDYAHRYYNDLTPTISDVYINHLDGTTDTTTGPEWRTVLLGGQRAGGRSLYMLDITNPADFTAANANKLVEWEFTDPSLGKTFSKPTIAMMNNDRFAAIFGNGYSDETDSSCTAKLFIVFLDGGQDGTWTLGTDYLVLDTGSGSTTDGDCNGLSTPAVVDLNRDRVADRVYAGDLKGNLWAFDLCNYDDTAGVEACTASGWTVGNISGTNTPIITANDGASPTANPQPITVQPVVSRDPSSTGGDDLIIVFGTGQYLTNDDKTNTNVQAMYGVRDRSALTNGGTGNWGLNPHTNNDKILEQEIVEATCTVTNCNGLIRTIKTPQANLGSNDNGWFIELPTSGERVVSNPKVRNNTLFFNTLIPDTAVCNAGGSGWLMSVNLANGGIPLTEIFDINNDGIIDVADRVSDDPPVGVKLQAIPAESTFLGDKQYTPDSTGTINVRDVNIGKTQREGRMSWREMLVE